MIKSNYLPLSRELITIEKMKKMRNIIFYIFFPNAKNMKYEVPVYAKLLNKTILFSFYPSTNK